MTERKRVSTGTPWEEIVGYSRAVKVGNIIAVSGTVASDMDGNIVGKGDAYAQLVFIIRKIEAALKQLGASLEDVVRTRIYTTDVTRWRDIAKAHHEFFAAVGPVNTLIQVQRFADPDMLVEMEADVVMDE